jgi:hypothetical protein
MLSPVIKLEMDPKGNPSTRSSKFKTNIPDIIGFSAGYRFISAGFAFLLRSGIRTNDDYAKSSYRTATIKYTGKAYSFQYKYLRFKGLTDVNPYNSITDRYIRRPDIVNKEFQFEGLYNVSWRKYSYIAPLKFSQHQIKSRTGLLFKTGVYYTQISGDSALVSKQQMLSEKLSEVNVIRSLSVRIAPGVGSNFVFRKKYYLFLAAFPCYDLYFYKYLNHPDEKVKGKGTLALVLDGKASLGYQSERIYAGLRYEVERRTASLQGMRTNNMYTYLGLEFGYRFKAPRVVKKVYKETMPPGM